VTLGALALASLLVQCTERPRAAEPPPQGPWNLPGQPPHLMAHYMPWYSTGGGDGQGAWDHWSWSGGGVEHDPRRLRADGRRDIASTLYPLIGPYDSSDPAVIRYHLATAKAAGIQAIAAIWYGPDNAAIDARVPLLLDEAQRQGLRVALCYEEKINFPPYRKPKSREDLVASAAADLAYIVQRYGGHEAYLKRDGRPFIFQFNYWGTGRLGPNQLTPDEWREVFAALPAPVVYARQNLDDMHHPPIQGAYVWWSPDEQWLRDFSQKAAALVEQQRLAFYMTMICPGFDDTGVWGWGAGPRKSEPFGLAMLQRTMTLATLNSPEIVQIVTWNDFNESTSVEPTVEHGFEFLDAIERWWCRRTGRTENLADNRTAYERYLRECSAAQRALLPRPAGQAGEP
jgi:hypothetical protein